VADERQTLLIQWLREVLGDDLGALVPASADASFRRYWRFPYQGRSLIAVDAPPEHEDSARFVRLARSFRRAELNAPEVLAEDSRRGFMVVSDLGARTYLSALKAAQAPARRSAQPPDQASDSDSASASASAQADLLYGDAIAALIRLQLRLSVVGLPFYDVAFLRRELELFRLWLLADLLRINLSVAEARDLERLYSVLVENALAQPYVAVHRDFHSRNLMLTETENPGILDLQDAVAGPLTYDLASLLKDCYIAWPRERVLGWLDHYAEQAQASGLLKASDRPKLLRWFDLMGAQRHLKAAGIFARLAVRDGKRGYLADLPRTLGYLQELGSLYAELQPLANLIRHRVIPRLSA